MLDTRPKTARLRTLPTDDSFEKGNREEVPRRLKVSH
jgi:hypothetical protein